MMNKLNVGVLLLLLGCSNTTEAAREIDKRAAATVDGHVQISNISGDITVTGWDKLEVKVTGELGKNSKLLFDSDGRRTTIKIVKERDSRNLKPTDLIVSIPKGSELVVSGISSEIEVRNVHGVQRLGAVSGEINADVFESDIEAKTMSGDVNIDGHGKSTLVTVTTISGDSKIIDVAGELETSTVSGEIDVQAGELTRARLKATNGDINVVADLAAGGRFESETVNGDITVNFEHGSDLNVDINTFNGDIENCFGLESKRASQYAPGRILQFDLGQGNRHVLINSMNGEVDICSKHK